MSRRLPEGSSPLRRTAMLAALLVASALALGAAGCGASDQDVNLPKGKVAFIQRCGSCHVLARAGTKGLTGPNLDQSFDNAIDSGFSRETVEGIVHEQILYPREDSSMPAKLADGQLAHDIAAYVADAVDAPGEDTGDLAAITPETLSNTGKVAKAENGELEIPADPNGQLAYEAAEAEAPAGALKINSPNEAPVDHNIAITSGGINAVGDVVKGGGVSTIDVDLKPGKYEYLCTVPGHAEAGMKGELVVK